MAQDLHTARAPRDQEGHQVEAGRAQPAVLDLDHDGLRILVREEGAHRATREYLESLQGPDYAAKKARVEHLYAIADGEVPNYGRANGRTSPLRGPRVLSLRYFNPVGADPQLRTGLQLKRPSHALGVLIQAHEEGRLFLVTGTDYPT
ncbi:hypothetical protein [Streptomyces sp. NPDC051452]|uniref:hypothetical protein n=1 Tax=Streptomyces sp. NPDC051452 TaxID=3365654 RepID=UPI00378BD4E2